MLALPRGEDLPVHILCCSSPKSAMGQRPVRGLQGNRLPGLAGEGTVVARHAQTLAVIAEAQAEREAEDQLLDQTLQVWQPRAARALTREDARQIVANFTGFFQVLSEWKAAELREEEKDLSSRPREVSS